LKVGEGESGLGETEGVRTLLGDPKRAIVKLSVPTIIGMSVQTVYNLADAFWVAGLGADALAAIGFFFPFFFMVMAVATGLGIGTASAISRRIGAGDKRGADRVASQSVGLMVSLGAALSLPLLIYSGRIFSSIGAGPAAAMATSYARIMFSGITVVFLANVGNSILRAEGDAKRAMRAMVLGSVLNIVLDPVFIYPLGLGVRGAAWASIFSMSISAGVLMWWLLIRADTYVSIRLVNLRFSRDVVVDILRVGAPSSFQQLSMSFTILVLNLIIVRVGGTDGVAVYSTGWRVVTVAILPLLGIASAVVPVVGAAYGAREFGKLRESFVYACRLGLAVEGVIGAATLLLAPEISAVFTYSPGARRISGDLTCFLQVIWIFYPGAALGIPASSVFQGTGRGLNALAATLLRTIVLSPPLCILFSSALGLGLVGVWMGLDLSNLLGSGVSYLWARHHISSISNR